MMITKLPESEGHVLGVEITGKVTLDEEKQLLGIIDGLVAEHGKVSALVVLGEKAGWGIEAGIEDLKWIMTHMKRIDRIAIVSDSKVWKWLVNLDSPFAKLVGIGEKHFKPAELAEAWAWIKGTQT